MSSASSDDIEAGEYVAKEGASTEPSLCTVCGSRPGTVCVHNVTLALGVEPPDPVPDQWLCRHCVDAQTVVGWVERVENVRRLMASRPASGDELQQAAITMAAHMRAEVERSGLVAPSSVLDFLERYAR